MFFGLINTMSSNRHKLIFLSNFPLLFYQPLPFFKKNVTSPMFLESKQNSNPHTFRNYD